MHIDSRDVAGQKQRSSKRRLWCDLFHNKQRNPSGGVSIKTLDCTLQHLNKFCFVYATKSSKIKCEKEAAVRAA